MNSSVHENVPTALIDEREHSSFGVLTLDPVRDQHGAVVDLQIRWANEWVLSNYGSMGQGLVVGSSLTQLLGDQSDSLPKFLNQLTNQGVVLFDIPVNNTETVQCRLTAFEVGYMAVVEPVAANSRRIERAGAKTVTTSDQQDDLLRENRELNLFFALSLELHCITDRNGNFLKVNSAWKTMLGYTEEELMTRNYVELIHPDDKVFALSGTPYLNDPHPTLRKCIRIRKKRGSYAFVEWHCDCTEDRQYISGREITEYPDITEEHADEVNLLTDRLTYVDSERDKKERRLVEEALRVSEQRFQAIFNLSYQYIGLMRPDGVLLEVNETALKAGGKKLSEVIGKPLWETIKWNNSADEQQRLRQAIQQAASGELVTYEVDVLDAQNNRIALDLSIKPIFNDNGQVVLLIPEGRDITKKKRGEDALRESEQRFREIAENVSDAFWIHSADSLELIYVNPAFERVVGYSAQQLNQNPQLLLEAIVEEDQARLTDIFTEYRLGKELTGQYRLKEGNNITRWFTVRTFVMKDCQDKPLRYIGVASDITSQKEKEIVLQQSLAREKELNKLKSQFVAIASHEFRTPLATIQSSVDLIGLYMNRNEPIDLPAMRRHLAVIEQEIVAFSNLLTDVLTIGKMEEGKISFNPRQVDFVALSQEVISTNFSEYRDSRRVQLSIQGKPVKTFIDDKLMRHVLINLLTNAFKFSSENPELFILFEERKLVISVKDQGIGIPTEDISSLFQPFFRAGNATSVQGTGLGLAISRQFVELHGGVFTVTSKENQGTTIIVTIPISIV
ncbi:PAS domain S-box protein [Spirosoma aerophilum]